MAGPTASVLLPTAFAGGDRRALRQWLADVGRYDETHQQWWPGDPAQVGLPVVADESGPFDVWAEPWEGEDGEEALVLTRHLGRPPVTQVVVTAAVDTAGAHLVLGHLVFALAHRYGGHVDFDGLLPLTGPDDGTVPAGRDRRERLRAAAAGMPGRLVQVPYPTAAGEFWAYHVGDAEFLAYWLRHPWFRMVK